VTGWFKAYGLLALSFLTTVLSRWLGLGRRYGIAAFKRNYDDDGLNTITAEERQTLLEAGRCIACGHCGRGDAALIREHGGRYPGLVQLVSSAARNPVDFAVGADGWQRIPEAELVVREALCPVGVPLLQLSRVVRQHGQPRLH